MVKDKVYCTVEKAELENIGSDLTLIYNHIQNKNFGKAGQMLSMAQNKLETVINDSEND